MNYPRNMFHPSWRRLVMSAFAVCLALIFSTTFVYAVGLFEVVDPLPNGCIRPTPPGEEAPLCCLSGFVYEQGQAVSNAEVRIFDAQGEIGKAYTQYHQGLEPKPYAYFDLTKLTRLVTPTDVITLVASFDGVATPPIPYTVQKGGQRFDFNLYNKDVLALGGQNTGVAEMGKFQRMSGADMDKQGNLYLWDTRNYRMQVLRPSGSGAWLDRPGWQLEIGSQPHQIYGGPHQIYGDGVAIDRKRDRVYIADPENGRIKVYTTDGDAIGIITITGYVQSIRTDDEGNLYALTMWDGIKKYNAKGQQIAHNANNFLIYNYIGRGIAVSRTGEVFFAKDVTDGIIKFSPDLQSHITVTLHLTSGLPVTRPTALIVDDQNTLFVFDHQKFKLFAFDANGNQLDRSWPSPPFQSGGGVFLAQHGDYIYLIGEYDGLILQLPKQGGEPLHTWGGIVGNHGSIGYPEDIAIAPDNSLFFADSWTGRIGKMINDQIVQS